MADYYSILEKTISGLPNNTPEVRSAVYKKARTAIETQLRNMSPAPSEEAIGSQLKLLEEAIVLIGSGYSVQPDPVPVPVPVPVLEEEPLQAELPPELVEPEVPVVSETISSPQTPISSETVTNSVIERVETAIDKVQTEAPQSVGLDEPVLSQQSGEIDSVAVDPNTKEFLDPIISADNASTPLQQVDLDEKKSGGFLSGLIKFLVILGIIGGSGYAIWKNKDALPEPVGSLLESVFGKEGVFENTATSIGEENPSSEPVVEVTETETPVVEPENTEPEVVVEPEVTEPEVVVEPEVAEPEPEVAGPEVVEPVTEPETTEETPPATEQSGIIPIGEVAYLYEEGSAGSGATRTNAAIIWELQQQSLKEGSAPEPVIVGKMDIPEKAMSIEIVLKRNIDEAVSASHMIEMRFNLPDDFTGKSVESIARFVMKATEEAPGEPLAAVPVKVSEGNFLIALDNLQQAVALNTQLIKGSAWIDVPVVYGTGKRALITLEKGGTGQRVFDEAFKDWQNR